ncbi:MAG: plasmid pRiA4b ORF-3 family protein [Deltaproteobacteria bacterium]|nr:plasmid pRiA4b ORF-3 family protein [Deltaproteobacteria bacterium]
MRASRQLDEPRVCLVIWRHHSSLDMPTSPAAIQLRVSLRGIRPLIWRRLTVPSEFSLDELHTVLQLAFGWTNSHLFAFTIEGRRYELSEDEIEQEALSPESPLVRTKLRDVLHTGVAASYEYDFGDSWVLDLVVEDEVTGTKAKSYPVCLDGERAGPPEDCGGTSGYQRLCRASRLRRLKGDPAEFHPEAFDQEDVNDVLRTLDIKHGPLPRRDDGMSWPESLTP